MKALAGVFDEIGIAHAISSSTANSNTTYITCMTHDLGVKLPAKYISYNFEQLTTDKNWTESVFQRFRRALMVWDFSLENVHLLRQRGIVALHVPLGWEPSMETQSRFHASTNRPIDVMFVGAMNARRSALLEAIRSDKSLISSLGAAWGPDLLRLYGQAKVALNLHFYGGRQLLETHRIIPLVVNRVWVVSEYSHDAWLDTEFQGVVNFTDGSNIANMTKLIIDYPHYDDVVQSRYILFKSCCKYITYVQRALDMQLGLLL